MSGTDKAGLGESALEQAGPARPTLRVVRGDATPEEIAALVAVLAAVGGGAPAEEPAEPSGWTDRSRVMRRPVAPGPGAWRASSWG